MKLYKLFLCFFIFTITTFSYAVEPVNLAQYKKALIQYHDSGEYEKDIEAVINNAKQYLQKRLATANYSHQKPAIVLDIDETSLSNFPQMKAMDFGGTLQQIKQAEMRGNGLPIKPTLKLYRFAKAHHIAVFFVSGRKKDEHQVTVANLKKAGYQNWDGLFLKDMNDHSTSLFKSSIRQRLIKNGYNIWLNVGDQTSDLTGGFADKAYKLPDPFYQIN